MPSQRKPGKEKVAVWLTPRERMLLKLAAKERGLTVADLFRQIVVDAEKRFGGPDAGRKM